MSTLALRVQVLSMALVLVSGSQIVYFDKYGDCNRGNPFDLSHDTYMLHEKGGGLQHENTHCRLNFKASPDTGVCLTFQQFDIQQCGVTLQIKTSNGNTPPENDWLTLSCNDNKPTQMCTRNRYVYVAVNKKVLNNNRGYNFRILVESTSPRFLVPVHDILSYQRGYRVDGEAVTDLQTTRRGVAMPLSPAVPNTKPTDTSVSGEESDSIGVRVGVIVGVIVSVSLGVVVPIVYCYNKRRSLAGGNDDTSQNRFIQPTALPSGDIQDQAMLEQPEPSHLLGGCPYKQEQVFACHPPPAYTLYDGEKKNCSEND